MTVTLAFVRHGETQPNIDGVLLGRSDVELTEHGREQAHALAALFAADDVRAIVSSPLRRARDTASVIATGHGLAVVDDPRLIEVDYGDWEGRPLGSIDAAESAGWRRDSTFAPPRGESLAHLHARVADACRELVAGPDPSGEAGGMIIAVSHVSPVKAAVAWALGVGPEIAWRMHLRLASVSRIVVRAGDPVLLTFDEVAHLSELPAGARVPRPPITGV